MPDFTATRSFLYVAGNIIDPVQNTTNETGIYSPHNASINAATGHTHSGNVGDGPKIPLIQPATRIVVGAAAALSATDVNISMTNAGAKVATFTQGASTAFSRYVTVYDGAGNASLFPITVTFVGGWLCQGLTDIVIAEDWQAITFYYDTVQWNIVSIT